MLFRLQNHMHSVGTNSQKEKEMKTMTINKILGKASYKMMGIKSNTLEIIINKSQLNLLIEVEILRLGYCIFTLVTKV